MPQKVRFSPCQTKEAPTMPIVSRSPKQPRDSSDRALIAELIRLIRVILIVGALLLLRLS